MYQQDYILRLIEQVGDVLRRMMHAIAAQRPKEALEESADALGAILDMDPGFVGSLAPEGLLSLLGAGGRLDVPRAALLAEVFAARATAYRADGAEAAAGSERRKAEMLAEAVLDHEDEGRAAERARIVLQAVGGAGQD